MALGDLNQDGRLDFATADAGPNQVTIALNNGVGGYATSTVGVGDRPLSVALGDLNGDGRLDFSAADGGSDQVTIGLADGIGGYVTSTVPVGDGPHSVALGDLNQDGHLDFATADINSNQVTIGLANGMGGYVTSIVSVFGAFSLALGDLNQDGRLDLAIAGNNELTLQLNTCDAFPCNGVTFEEASGSPVGVEGPSSLALGDLNKDGRLDFATADFRFDQVTIGLADGKMEVKVWDATLGYDLGRPVVEIVE